MPGAHYEWKVHEHQARGTGDAHEHRFRSRPASPQDAGSHPPLRAQGNAGRVCARSALDNAEQGLRGLLSRGERRAHARPAGSCADSCARAERERAIGAGAAAASPTKNRTRIDRGVAGARQTVRAAIRPRIHRQAPPPRLVSRALISRPRPLPLEVRKLVDVVHDTGVIDLEDLHPFGMVLYELARAVVAVQGGKFLVEAPRESDRMSAL